jgi:hypothetical protein
MATSKSESLKKYLNDNYASSIKDADNNETYYCHFNGEYFVKCLVTETVVRKQSSNHGPMTKYNEATYPKKSTEIVKTENYYIFEKNDDTTARLSYFLPIGPFTAEKIEEIVGSSDYNEFGIVE